MFTKRELTPTLVSKLKLPLVSSPVHQGRPLKGYHPLDDSLYTKEEVYAAASMEDIR
jgi:hypothetical protein